MSGTNKAVISSIIAKKGSTDAIIKALENANEVAIKVEGEKKPKK